MDKRILVVLDTVPSITKEVAKILREVGSMEVVEAKDIPLDKLPPTFDKRDAFVKRVDKRLHHNPQAYLNINRRQTKRRF